ncbi:hypothetical protein MKW98_032552 [Papaver atlanticum]|uniref:Uncharacterized protein n=1 Tax=Papaver atlanticum TaxID=357466 RepID=A0AAD4SWP6_9MAGN|nr:hypothetical protein MKW98_032552 [Papaver atlanticum]
MRVLVAVSALVMAASAVQNVAAADAPAPSPTSDATSFAPAVFASMAAVAIGYLF